MNDWDSNAINAIGSPWERANDEPQRCEECFEPVSKCICPCPECGDDEDLFWAQSACIDDMCHGGEVPCMHGDWARLPCHLCGK